jgi:hypothetical protein
VAAEDCPEIDDLVRQARAAFDDAELDDADERLDLAHQSLGCQRVVVTTEVLIDLYRLAVLVDLARQDREGAVFHTIRAVVTDPSSAPPAELGPQVAELHNTWSSRLSAASFAVSLEGADAGWVDGHPLDAEAPYRVLAGEHLLQWRDVQGFHSEVRDLSSDHRLRGAGRAVAELPPEPVVEPEPRVRRGPPSWRWGVGAAGGAIAAGGGVGLAWFSAREADFLARPYDPANFRDDAAREAAIRADASSIRLGYLASYAAIAVGAAGVGVAVVPGAGGAALAIGGRW